MLFVMKFGGSSLADGERLCRAAERVALRIGQGHRVVAVVSAQGDTTDALIEKARSINPSPGPRELDQCVSTGEQLSAALMAMALEARGIPAVSLTGPQAGLLTDGTAGDARPLGLSNDRIASELAGGKAVVVAGYQGAAPNGDTVTLGRGGSDTTAVALAAYLQADHCLIYTDVDGVYDKDPRKFPDAVHIPVIGYDAMLAMTRQGAQVLHDRCVELGKRYRVPIRVLSSFRPGEGTLVTEEESFQNR